MAEATAETRLRELAELSSRLIGKYSREPHVSAKNKTIRDCGETLAELMGIDADEIYGEARPGSNVKRIVGARLRELWELGAISEGTMRHLTPYV